MFQRVLGYSKTFRLSLKRASEGFQRHFKPFQSDTGRFKAFQGASDGFPGLKGASSFSGELEKGHYQGFRGKSTSGRFDGFQRGSH